MIQNIIIKGERCSGTNYLQHLILTNTNFEKCGHHLSLSPSPEVEAVWKHGLYDDAHVQIDEENTLFLIIHRNINDWLRSLYQIPWHLPVRDSFYEFITASICCDECEYHFYPIHEYVNGERYCGDIIDLRYIKLQNWMVNLRNYRLIDYDQLTEHPGMIVGVLRSYGIPLTDEFSNWERYKDTEHEYRKKEYPPLSDKELLYIHSKINPDIERMITT